MTIEITAPHDGVLVLKLNRPEKLNALTQVMYQVLNNQLINAAIDPTIQVVLLTGTKDCFTSGNDLADFLSFTQNVEAGLNELHHVHHFLHTLSQFPKPLIAAVNGPCIGIGTTLLLHCDLVYAGQTSLFQMPFIKLGLTPEAGASLLLPRLIGHVKACEYLLLCEKFDAHEALSMGFINQIYPTKNYFQEAYEKAIKLAQMPTEAVILAKQLLKKPLKNQLKEIIDEEVAHFSTQLRSSYTQKALQHFFNK